MPRSLSDDSVRRLRLRAQRLTPDPESAPDAALKDDPHKRMTLRPPQGASAVMHRVVGFQAQDARAAALSVRARRPALTADDVAHALVEERTVVRTWLMRGSLHLAAADDVPWLLSALAPRFKKTSRRRREQIGLDDETAARAAQKLEEVLRRRGPLARTEIRATPTLEDVPLEGQAAPHLLRYAALDGRICHGPMRDGKPTYVPLTDWIDLPDPPPEHEARATLTRRYLKAYGPAGPRDMARWSGLTLTQCRKDFEQINDKLTEVGGGEEPMWMLASEARALNEPTERPIVRLLPKYDTLLMGYRSRDWILPAEYAKRIYPGGGLLRRSVLADGRIVGTWNPEREDTDALRVMVDLFEDISPAARDALAAETDNIGRFFGKEGTQVVA